MRVLAGVALLALVGVPRAQEQDALAILAAARQAMGGDAVLDAIASLSVTGTESQDLGRVATIRSIEIHYQRPDKYVRMTRTTFNDPFGGGFTMTSRKGFNGGVRIDSVIAPGAPMPVVIPAPEPATAQEQQAAEAEKMRRQRQEFAKLFIPLFAASPDAYPVTFRVDAGAVIATGNDGTEMKLFFDAATRLPARVVWMADPVVMFTTSSTVTTNSRGDVVSRSPNLPLRPPPVPQSQVEWSMTIEDYKTQDGLTWPRRFRTSFAGRPFENVSLNKYRVNPRINASVFEPRR